MDARRLLFTPSARPRLPLVRSTQSITPPCLPRARRISLTPRRVRDASHFQATIPLLKPSSPKRPQHLDLPSHLYLHRRCLDIVGPQDAGTVYTEMRVEGLENTAGSPTDRECGERIARPHRPADALTSGGGRKVVSCAERQIGSQTATIVTLATP